MLDLELEREAVPPKPAATLILVRDATGDASRGVEVFCVERNKKSRFLGGAIVFPGGKVDASDGSEEWAPVVRPARDARLTAHVIAACRESLEEAAILPVSGGAMTDQELGDLRARHAQDPTALRTHLATHQRALDLGALVPFARWVTPTAESRRYDTWFFVAIAPRGQSGAHDEGETTASFWATPAAILERFANDEVQLAPPTHRTLEILASCANTAEVVLAAERADKEPICPKLVPQGDTLALVLPGDPEHEVREARAPGCSRYVRRGERWRSEDPPA